MFELEEQTQTEILRSNQSSTVLELAKFSWNQGSCLIDYVDVLHL